MAFFELIISLSFSTCITSLQREKKIRSVNEFIQLHQKGKNDFLIGFSVAKLNTHACRINTHDEQQSQM